MQPPNPQQQDHKKEIRNRQMSPLFKQKRQPML